MPETLSLRQAKAECLELLTVAAPTVKRLHTRMSEDPSRWLDALDEWELQTVGMALSFATLSIGDISNPPPEVTGLN